MPRSVGVAITARAKRCQTPYLLALNARHAPVVASGFLPPCSHSGREARNRRQRLARASRFLASLLPLRKGPWIDANPRGGLVITARPTKEPLSFHHLTPPDFRLKPPAVIFLKAEG